MPPGHGEATRLAPCPNCGAVVPDIDGPTHAYMISSPGCWAAFGRLQAGEPARSGYQTVHGLAVDAFAASHGGDGSQRRDRQSVCLHLMALCLVLQRGQGSRRRMALLRGLTAVKRDWPRLERPEGVPALSHTHAAHAGDGEEYAARVTEWAQAVWAFWAPEHERIARLIDAPPGR